VDHPYSLPDVLDKLAESSAEQPGVRVVEVKVCAVGEPKVRIGRRLQDHGDCVPASLPQGSREIKKIVVTVVQEDDAASPPLG